MWVQVAAQSEEDAVVVCANPDGVNAAGRNLVYVPGRRPPESS
jgi:hypothetical protein